MKYLLLCALFALVVSAASPIARAADDDFEVSLSGTIGSLPVRARLFKNGATLAGEYVYETKRASLAAVTTRISLEGTIGRGGSFTLRESHDEKTTGSWSGTIASDGSALSGTWTAAGAKRELPIALARLTSNGAGARLVTHAVRPTNPKLADVVDVDVPRLEGSGAGVAAFNAAVDALAKEWIDGFEQLALDTLASGAPVEQLGFDVDYEVTAFDAAVVSVLFTTYSSAGGAHPSTSAYGLTIDLVSGKKLELDDLFANRESYRRLLAARVEAVAKGAGEIGALVSSSSEEIGEFFVTPRGLVLLVFVPHVAGDYAEVYLPSSDLAPMLSPRGRALFS